MEEKVIACLYDCDGTLIPGNMQEPFLAQSGIKAADFWSKNDLRRRNSRFRGVNLDAPHCYMNMLIEYSRQGKIPSLTNKGLREYGAQLQPFVGLPEFFGKINGFGRELGVTIEHYIISTGLKEMIAGSCLNVVDDIFACEYSEQCSYAARTVNFIEKTRYVFEINKGVNKGLVTDVNNVTPNEERRIPLSQMLFTGNSLQDVPCISVLQNNGGSAFVVYDEQNSVAKVDSRKLLIQGRVDKIYPANFLEESEYYQAYTARIREIAESIK
jgi:hypothetical protein